MSLLQASPVEAFENCASQCNGILKLHVGDTPARHINIDCLVDNEGNLSFQKLLKLTAPHNTYASESTDAEDFPNNWTVQIYCINNKNEWSKISCDVELTEAFQHARNSLKKPIRTIRNAFSKYVVAIDDGSRTPVLICKALLMERIANNKMPNAPGANGYIPVSLKRVGGRNAPRRHVAKSSSKPSAKRWTSPPTNNRRHVQKVVRSFATGISSVTDKIHTKLLAAANYRLSEEDRTKIIRFLENVHDAVEEKATAVEENLYNTIVKATTEEKGALNLSNFDRTFIHGRHTCDGCKASPILGIRYHATNISNFDLCDNCIEKFDKSGIKFLPEQLVCDACFQVGVNMQYNDESANIEATEAISELPPPNDVSIAYTKIVEEIVNVDLYKKEDTTHNHLTITKHHCNVSKPQEVTIAQESEIENFKQDNAGQQHVEKMMVEVVTVSEFDLNPSVPGAVTVTTKSGDKGLQSWVTPQKLMSNVGTNLERCVLALGGAVHEAVEGGIKFGHKTRDQAVTIAATVAAAARTSSSSTADQHGCSEVVALRAVEESKRLAYLFAEERRKGAVSPPEGAPSSYMHHDIIDAFRSGLPQLTKPASRFVNGDTSVYQGAVIPAGESKHRDTYDDANSGRISDEDFQMFLSWWSTSEKVSLGSKQQRHKKDEKLKGPSVVVNNGELSDEQLSHFFSLCTPIHNPPSLVRENKYAKVSDTIEPRIYGNNLSKGELSDEEFNRFVSEWSTCEKRSLSFRETKADLSQSYRNDGTLTDSDFKKFLYWWSTTKRSIDSHIAGKALVNNCDSFSFKSVEISSSVIPDEFFIPDTGEEMSSEGIELELEDGTIVISPYFGGHVELRGIDDWDFIDSAIDDNAMLGSAAVTIGSSLFREDWTRSIEAITAPTVTVSNVSGVALSKESSRVSLDSSLSLVSAVSTEFDESEMSIVSSVESIESWSSM